MGTTNQALEQIPAEARWTIAAQALTGADVATSKAIFDALGPAKHKEIMEQIWGGGGQASKQIADSLGLGGADLASLAQTITLVAVVAMGPELNSKTVEVTADKAVVRATACPWWNRMKEMGITDALCTPGDAAWCNAFAKSLNPKVSISLTKAMPRGDPYCEWIYTIED